MRLADAGELTVKAEGGRRGSDGHPWDRSGLQDASSGPRSVFASEPAHEPGGIAHVGADRAWLKAAAPQGAFVLP